MAEYWPRSFFFPCFMDQDKFKVNMNAKKEEANKFNYSIISS